jgi:sec-independent protein translocase protein TatA
VFDFSPVQIIIVLAIALLIFGPKRLPELGRSLGRGIRDFRSGISGNDEPATPATTDVHAEDEVRRPAVTATSVDDDVVVVDAEPARQTA